MLKFVSYSFNDRHNGLNDVHRAPETGSLFLKMVNFMLCFAHNLFYYCTRHFEALVDIECVELVTRCQNLIIFFTGVTQVRF